MRKNYKIEIIKLRAVDVLGSLIKLSLPFFETSSIYRVSASEFRNEIGQYKDEIRRRVNYLKKMGYIETFVAGKERYYEITDKGLKRIKEFDILHPQIHRPTKWDRKWRIVIFDVPNKMKNSRDAFRLKLLEIGFQKIQESVYVYPYECTQEVSMLSEKLMIQKYVSILISEIIQGEEQIILSFIEQGVLNSNDLK